MRKSGFSIEPIVAVLKQARFSIGQDRHGLRFTGFAFSHRIFLDIENLQEESCRSYLPGGGDCGDPGSDILLPK
mgnify:CR=1 FL=1